MGWDTVTTTTILNCWKKTGIVNADDTAIATQLVEANIQDEELQLNSALNILEPLVDYEIVNSQEYIDIPTENEAIQCMFSIEEIVNAISQPDDTDNSDDDGPEPLKYRFHQLFLLFKIFLFFFSKKILPYPPQIDLLFFDSLLASLMNCISKEKLNRLLTAI